MNTNIEENKTLSKVETCEQVNRNVLSFSEPKISDMIIKHDSQLSEKMLGEAD